MFSEPGATTGWQNPFKRSSSISNVEFQLGKAYSGVVYACVNAIAEEGATFTPVLKRRVSDDYEVVEDHPLLDLLKNPNEEQGDYDLYYWTITQLELTGNAFWWLPGFVLGTPTEIVPLSSARVSVDEKTEEPVYEYINVNGGKRKFTADEIIHFKKPDPLHMRQGKSPVVAVADAIDNERLAVDYQLSVFNNRAMPGGLITTDETLDQDQQQKIKNALNEYRGTSNAGLTMVLSGGDYKWNSLSTSNSDLELIATRNFNMKYIMMLFKVPPTILGIQENSNRATAEANRFTFQTQVIVPLMRLMAEAIGHKLLPRYDTRPSSLKLEFKDPVIPDKEYKLREWIAGIDRWMTPNEVREQAGLPKLDDGSGDVLLRPPATFPLADVENTPTLENPLPPEPEDEPTDN